MRGLSPAQFSSLHPFESRPELRGSRCCSASGATLEMERQTRCSTELQRMLHRKQSTGWAALELSAWPQDEASLHGFGDPEGHLPIQRQTINWVSVELTQITACLIRIPEVFVSLKESWERRESCMCRPCPHSCHRSWILNPDLQILNENHRDTHFKVYCEYMGQTYPSVVNFDYHQLDCI